MTIRPIAVLGTALVLVGAILAGPPVTVPHPPSTPPLIIQNEGAMPGPGQMPLEPALNGVPMLAEGGNGMVWLSADYLMSFLYGSRVQPLVTSGPADSPRSTAGVLAAPGTETLFSGRMNEGLRNGIRVQGGFWFSPERNYGLEMGGSLVESLSTLFSNYNDGNAILARPYINVLNQANESVLVSYPDFSRGGITARIMSGNFYEAHIDLVENWLDSNGFRIDGMIGYRFYRYDEGMSLQQTTITTNDPNFITGTTISATDTFTTQNEFHGGEFGLRGSYQWERLNVELLGKIAVGPLRRWVKISGSQVVSVPGSAPEQRASGVFALPTNIGVYKTSEWSSLPELGITLRYALTDYLTLRAGYNVLFMNSISRADQQLDARINPNYFAGGSQTGDRDPRPTELRDNVWLMNIGLGLEVAY